MLLTNEQIKKLREWTKGEGMALTIKNDIGGAWGSVRRMTYSRDVVSLMIVNEVQGVHIYTDATGATVKTTAHDPRKTLAHEYTHILQIKAGYYERIAKESHIYNYNEVVANTIGMLCFPTESNIIDNAGYVNRYTKKGTGDLMKHLEHDIDELFPKVEAFLQSLGIL